MMYPLNSPTPRSFRTQQASLPRLPSQQKIGPRPEIVIEGKLAWAATSKMICVYPDPIVHQIE